MTKATPRGVSQGCATGRTGIRLCNLIAQGAGAAEGGVRARGGATPDRQRDRAVGDALFQDVSEPAGRH